MPGNKPEDDNADTPLSGVPVSVRPESSRRIPTAREEDSPRGSIPHPRGKATKAGVADMVPSFPALEAPDDLADTAKLPPVGRKEALADTPRALTAINTVSPSAGTEPFPVVSMPATPLPGALTLESLDIEFPVDETDPHSLPKEPRRPGITWAQASVLGAACLLGGLALGYFVGGTPEKPNAVNNQAPPPVDSKPTPLAHAITAVVPGQATDAAVPSAVPIDANTVPPVSVLSARDCKLVVNVPRESTVTVGAVSVPRGKVTKVACGPQLLQVVHPRYQKIEEEIDVGERGVQRWNRRLEREKIDLTIETVPVRGIVSFNKLRMGRAPLTRTVPAFERFTLKVSSPGYESHKQNMYPKESKTITIRLHKSKKSDK